LALVPISRSRRIVVELEDISLKRNLYAVLAAEGRSLKDWFAAMVNDYLSAHSAGKGVRIAKRVAEKTAAYEPRARRGGRG